MLRKLFVCAAGALLLFPVGPARAGRDVDDDNWRPDVLRCEEAVAKLVACCPHFLAHDLACTYEKIESSSGCDFFTTTRVTPALDEVESACVLDSECAGLEDSGVCARAQAVGPYVSVSRGSIDSPPGAYEASTHPAVCP